MPLSRAPWCRLVVPTLLLFPRLSAQPSASINVAADIIATRVTGHCTVTSTGSMEPRVIKNGDPLPSDVTIHCSESSSVVLISLDGVSAQLGAASKLKIDALGSPRVHGGWTLETGEIVVKVRTIGTSPPPKFVLQTPGGRITTSSASFRVLWRRGSDGKSIESALHTVTGAVAVDGPILPSGSTAGAAPPTLIQPKQPSPAESTGVTMALQAIALAEATTTLRPK